MNHTRSTNRLNPLTARTTLSSPTIRPRRPLTPGQRHQVLLTKVKDGLQWSPKHLRQGKMKTGGRNSQGVMVSRHLGNGDKQLVRKVHPLWPGHRVLVLGTQWDPSRNAPVSLVFDLDLLPQGVKREEDQRHERLVDEDEEGALVRPPLMPLSRDPTRPSVSYVLTGKGMQAGMVLQAPVMEKKEARDQGFKEEGEEVSMELQKNVRCQRSWLPVGTQVYDMSLSSSDPLGSSHFKAAGVYGRILAHGLKAKEGQHGTEHSRLRFPSGEERRVPSYVYATVGSVACEDTMLESIGKAGKVRSQGVRPTVRGCAMNPIDHPHGGRTKGGRHEVTPWAMVAKGRSTRSVSERSGLVLATARDKKRQARVKTH